DWMMAKLQGNSAAAQRLGKAPETCVELDSTGDAVTLGSAPRGTAALKTTTIPPTNVVLDGTQFEPVPLKLITLTTNNVLAGLPKATFTLSAPSPVPPELVPANPVGIDEPIVFVGLARGRFNYDSYCHQYADPFNPAPTVFCTPIETVEAPLLAAGQ